MKAIVTKRDQPMPSLGHRRDASAGVGAGFERCIKIGRWPIVAGEAVGVEFHINRGVRDRLVVVLGTHANFGGQWNFFRQRPSVHLGQKGNGKE